MTYFFKFAVAPTLVLLSSWVYGISPAQESFIQLQWRAPSMQIGHESSFSPSLFFEGAVFTDTLPQIPVYIWRESNDVPHFVQKFSITNKTIGLCTPDEIKILEKSGFDSPEFIIKEDIEDTRGTTYSRLHIIPVRKRDGTFEKLLSFSIISENVFSYHLKFGQGHQYPDSSVLAKGLWYKLCVQHDGIYRLTAQDLTSLGINISQIEKSTIQIFGNGGGMLPEANSELRFTDPQENPIWVSGGNSGAFTSGDYVLFYGQSPLRWIYNTSEGVFRHQPHFYSNETCYFLTFGQSTGKRINKQPSNPNNITHNITTFLDYSLHEHDIINIIGSGKIWFGEAMEGRTRHQFSFPFAGLNTQRPAHVRVFAAGRSSTPSSFTIQALNQTNTLNIGSIVVADIAGFHARTGTSTISAVPENEIINVTLNYNSTASGAQGWLGYIAVNAWRNLALTGDQMMFRDPSSTGAQNRGRFQISNAGSDLRIWDVSDPFNIREHSTSFTGNIASFDADLNILREFVAFSGRNYLVPALRGAIVNQNLHASNVHDLVIVVPDIFRSEAERLAEFRRTHDGLSVLVVSPQQIYNEFSSGVPDISAIRNFMRMLYDRGIATNNLPSYLLLFGNGTYDNKNKLGFGGNFIPTFQTLQSLNFSTSYISDDFFGLLSEFEGLDGRGSLDIGIGRFPVRTAEEAKFVVDKVLRYNRRIDGLHPGTTDPQFAGLISNFADWRNVITIIADDEDGNIHLNQSEDIASYIRANHQVYNIDKIYLDAFQQTTLAGGSRYPDVNRAINNRVNQGSLLINYIGHGGLKGLAHERILTFDDIRSWNNFYNLHVFMTATCEFSNFDQPDPNELSAGVRVFLRPNGGAAALFTTTRLAYSHTNFTLNDAFIRNAFIPMENGKMPRLGDLIRISKVISHSNPSLKNFVLLGDPSMQMAYPKYRAITTSMPDTIRALEKITVEGIIVNPDGTPNQNYKGFIFPTVFDKATTYSTMRNDPGSFRKEFESQNRIIFNGKSTIENGRFSFTFVVPRDINYNIGYGKISYYFDDGVGYDGNGYFTGFTVAGTTKEYIADNSGPQIDLFINDTTFISGSKTEPDPILMAFLYDENGINTTGHIGHDILAILNGNTANPLILNNFYRADPDSYRSGRVIYQLSGLEPGEYSLTLRAWDTHNNPTSETIYFTVTPSLGITITELTNKPNPFDLRTTFSIRHNKPTEDLDVKISIFNLSGQLVRTIESEIYASGFEVSVDWDGTDESGGLLRNGMYIFRVQISTENGSYDVKSERLVILR